MSAPCPACGAFTVSDAAQRSALLAVCDVLVVKALERLGNLIMRAPGSRGAYHQLSARPRHEVHTLRPAGPRQIDPAIRGAWDVIPAVLGDDGLGGIPARQVQAMLDDYVYDLASARVAHTMEGLAGRFQTVLGVTVSHSHEAVGA